MIEPQDYTKLTQEQRRRLRLRYIEAQDGKCAHCEYPLDYPPVKDKTINDKLFPVGFFNNPVHLHHNHVTGMTIGAVHAYCNAVLWQYFGE